MKSTLVDTLRQESRRFGEVRIRLGRSSFVTSCRLPAIKTFDDSKILSVKSASISVDAHIHGYDRVFWLAYLSNGLTTFANGMLVRYADFVNVVGGDEQQLGLIVGCGMIGSIVFRIVQGEAVDRYGASRVWLWSTVFYTLSLLLHPLLTTAYGPGIFLTRTLMQASLAGVFGASITFISLRVSADRMAEIVGSLGTSGFLGLMLGPLCSDWLASGESCQRQSVEHLFLFASSIAGASVFVTWLTTNRSVVPRHRRRPPLLKVVARYHPMMILMAASVMGAGLSIPMTFLRPFAVEAKLSGVGIYFLVYAATGFAARLASRSFFQRFGNRWMISVGLVLLSLSFLAYIPVTQTSQLVFPAAVAGVAHAFLFPSIMAAGTAVFPRRYLGVATSLLLAMLDIGTLIAAPVVGAFLHLAKQRTPNAYPWMFATTAIVFALMTLVFFLRSTVRRSALIEK